MQFVLYVFLGRLHVLVVHCRKCVSIVFSLALCCVEQCMVMGPKLEGRVCCGFAEECPLSLLQWIAWWNMFSSNDKLMMHDAVFWTKVGVEEE